METLKRHLHVSGQEGLHVLWKIAIRFEEKISTAATSQSDYLAKIYLKLLTLEGKYIKELCAWFYLHINPHCTSLFGVVFLTPKSSFHVSSWIIYTHAYLHAYVHIQKHRYMFICVCVQFFFLLGHGSVIPVKMSKDVILVTS